MQVERAASGCVPFPIADTCRKLVNDVRADNAPAGSTVGGRNAQLADNQGEPTMHSPMLQLDESCNSP